MAGCEGEGGIENGWQEIGNAINDVHEAGWGSA